MLKNRQASDDEATVLAERLQARLQLAHPLRYTTVYSSVLTAPQAVRILSSDDATTTGVVTDPFMKLSAAELAHLKATDEVLDSARRFFVTVRNLDRDEEYAHPEPLETLKDWHLHFLDRPIFRLVNVAKEPDFVTLQAPTARNLWATTKLVKAEQLFHVVVSFAPLAPSSILPNLYTDTVLVYLRTPRLPTDHVTFRSLMRTSDQRRAVALHYALQAFAKQFGFRVYPGASAAAAAPVPPRPADPALQQATAQATLLHGDRVVISDACTTTTLCGAVVSGVSETSAGSVVIPLVLKFVRFLLPALRDNVPLCYDLVQPHRFGYTFQVRSIGGWQLLGAVNMHASPEAIRVQFQLRDLTASPDIDSADAAAVSMGVPTTMVACASLAHSLHETLANVKRELLLVFRGWVNARGHDASLSRPFADPADANLFNFASVTTDEQKMALPPDVWRGLMTYTGLMLVRQHVQEKWNAAADGFAIQRANRFIHAWLSCMRIPPYPAQVAPLPITDVAGVLFDVCLGVAEAALAAMLATTPAAQNRGATLQTVMVILSAYSGTNQHIIIPIPQFVAFVRSCRGTPPKHWCSSERASFFKDPVRLAALLLYEPQFYSTLFPASAMIVKDDSNNTQTVKERLSTVAFHDTTLMAAYEAAGRCIATPYFLNNPAHRHTVVRALAYVLLTNDHDGFLARWQ